MSDTTFTFHGVSSTTIPELLVTRVRRPLVGDRRDDYVDVPGREGFWLFEEKAGSRIITIELDVQADSFAERRAAIIALADLLDAPAGLSELIVSDEPDRFHRCRLASNPDPDEWLTAGTIVVELIAEPYSYATAFSTEAYGPVASGTVHPFTVGDKVYAIPVVEVTANGGTMTGFTLAMNGDTFTYGTGGVGLASGETVTISTLAYVLTRGASGDPDLDGTFDPADLDMATVSGDFPYVVAGANSITVTKLGGTAATITVSIYWRRRHR